MRNKKTTVGMIFILACLVILPISLAQNNGISVNSPVKSKNDLREEAEKTRTRILQAGQDKDLKSLVALANEVEATWTQKDIPEYAGLMITICGELNSRDFNDNYHHYLFVNKYAKQALEKSDQMPIGLEVELVGFITGDAVYGLNLESKEDWMQDRTERTKLFFHAWQRLEKEIDWTFDANSDFKPNLKSPYEMQREERQRDYNQRNLHHFYSRLSELLEIYATSMYTKNPTNSGELQYYLESYVHDDNLRQKIVKNVENKIAEAP